MDDAQALSMATSPHSNIIITQIEEKNASIFAQGMGKVIQVVIFGSKKFGSTARSIKGLGGSQYQEPLAHGSAVDLGSLMKK